MRTRFAPSPTGPLHLGHAFSAMLAHDMARAANGAFLLRIEDIDRSRARPEWEDLIYEDLTWLGLTWDEPVMRQSDRHHAYEAALDLLWAKGLLYPCACNRRDIREAASAPQEGALMLGPDGIVYPGTCRPAVPPAGSRPRDQTMRLNMAAAIKAVANSQAKGTNPAISASTFPTFKTLRARREGEEIVVNPPADAMGNQKMNVPLSALTEETMTPAPVPLTYQSVKIASEELTTKIGDVVLARRDMGTSYHLSVVVDDAAQGITHVTRGADLFEATPIHVLLQALLGLPTPAYLHHRLIRDEKGKRLAKRDDARAIRLFREAGDSPADIRARLGLGGHPA